MNVRKRTVPGQYASWTADKELCRLIQLGQINHILQYVHPVLTYARPGFLFDCTHILPRASASQNY